MKSLKNTGILICMLISFSAATAQKKTDVDGFLSKRFDTTLMRIKKTDLSKSKEVQKTTDELLAKKQEPLPGLQALMDETDKRRVEIETKRKQYIPSPSGKQLLDKDVLAFLAGIPEPVSSLPQATKMIRKSEQENIYTRYIETIKAHQKSLMEQARQSIPADMKDPEKMKQAAYQNAQNTQHALDNNTIIQEMGGMEKLKNMSPEQRAALGKQMADKAKQNPSAFAGQQNDPQKAFTQKMMNDPAYAARFNHMNDQQKQEEYKAFMAANGFVDNFSQADKDKRTADHDRAATSMAIEKKLALIRQHAQEMADIVGRAQLRTDDYFTGVYKKLNEEYAARVAALPVIEMGEVGHGKDTHPVDIAYNIVLCPIEAQNAAASKEVWKRYVEMAKVSIAEYNELLSEFWGRDKMTDEIMAEKGLTPAALSAGICDDLIDLTKKAESRTNQNATWQRTYQEIVFQVYE